MKFSDWLNQIRTNPNVRSPHWNNWEKDHGFYGARVSTPAKPSGYAFQGFDRTAGMTKGLGKAWLDKAVSEMTFSEDKDHFKCWAKNHKYVDEVWYDRDKMTMKVAHVNSRTCMRGASVKGTITIYDHVPPNVFDYLKDINDDIGHVGAIFWQIIRLRGSETVSHYPYMDRES